MPKRYVLIKNFNQFSNYIFNGKRFSNYHSVHESYKITMQAEMFLIIWKFYGLVHPLYIRDKFFLNIFIFLTITKKKHKPSGSSI